MFQSFDGVLDVPGDTQPDSQMFRQYTSGIVDSHSNLVPTAPPLAAVEGDTSADPATDDFEAVTSSPSPHSPTVTSPTIFHDDMDTQFHLNDAPTSPLKFETPALAGRKRNNQGQLLSSAVRTNTTPGTVLSASAFFGFGDGAVGNPMSLTQAFNATQAGTSPLVALPAEDPVFQRPSPNFTTNRQSSPPVTRSSPIKVNTLRDASTVRSVRSSSEPRVDYETMKQSQERRSLEPKDSGISTDIPDSWDQPTSVERLFRRRKAKENFDEQAARSLATVSAPSSSPRRRRKRGMLFTKVKYRSPSKLQQPGLGAFDGPPDFNSDNESPDESSQPVPVNGQDEYDSPDELSQGITHNKSAPRTQIPRTIVKDRTVKDQIQVPNTSSHPPRTFSGRPARKLSQPDTPSSQALRQSRRRASASQLMHKDPSKMKSSRESEIIFNSQPDHPTESLDNPRPKSLRFPSSPSTNQYSINFTATNVFSSQHVSSSIPPMPPRSSSQELGDPEKHSKPEPQHDHRVPSSPPIVRQEAEDRHAHDEDKGVSRPKCDDVDVGDDDDLLAHGGEGLIVAMEAGSPASILGEDQDSPTSLKHHADMPLDEERLEAVEEQEDRLLTEEEALSLSCRPDEPLAPAEQGELGDLYTEEEDWLRSSLRDRPPEPLDKRYVGVLLTEEENLAISSCPDDLPEMAEHEEDHVCTGDDHVVQARSLPHVKRQSTIPETDFIDDTQPSFFPEAESAAQYEQAVSGSRIDEPHARKQTNSTDAFVSAQEQQSVYHSVNYRSAKDGASLQSSSGRPVRSLDDIANQPDTQHSTNLDAIDMPRLSFAAEPEDPLDTIVSESSSRLRKKRKTTYGSKNRGFRSLKKEGNPLPDQAPSSFLKDTEAKQRWTPEPTQQREVYGTVGDGEDTLMPSAVLKAKVVFKPVPPQTPRNGALKPINKVMLKNSPSDAQSKSKKSPSHTAPVKPAPSAIKHSRVDVKMHDTDAQRSDAFERAPPLPAGTVQGADITTASDDGEGLTGELLIPNRVLAFWPGLQHYYPATCLGRADTRRLRVRYDDGHLNVLDPVHVLAFDLRLGDHVKVDYSGMKKNTYIVVGFKDRVEVDGTPEYPITDRHGFAKVVVEEKQRESVSAAIKAEPKKHIEVPMGSLYMTTSLWGRIRDRSFKYTPDPTPAGSASRIGTPGASEGAVSTPPQPRRGTAGPSLLRESIVRAASVASSVRAGGSSFVNMAFAITLTNEHANKDAITKEITSNGGQVLDAGFHELFDIDAADGPVSSEGTFKVISGLDGLLLKREYRDLGFVALISDSHCRTTKYVQALALNIPCLHIRWIHDSTAASRALPFTRYLLPAGLSTHLAPEGVIRSRTMPVFDPSGPDTSFLRMVGQRALLLHEQSVLVVTGKSRKDMERKQPYLFLTHALGPATVARCNDLAAARSRLATGHWDWVFVDGGKRALADAAHVLFGEARGPKGGKKGGARKRKREESADEEALVRVGARDGRTVKIGCDELVIQSLILGEMIED